MPNHLQIDSGNSPSRFILYTDLRGKIEIEVYFADESMWMTQKQMGELFEVDRSVVTKHLANVYSEGEIEKSSTSAKFAQVQLEGNREVTRAVEYYNLDAIISVGYRVNSRQATRFRQWATRVLHEYIQKGFALNDERFKKGYHFDEAYFDELLERIREIRLSERRMYLKLTDIFALSSDYSRTSELAREFFAFIQNKLHFAIAGKTAAEIIHSRADADKAHMGLTTWEAAPDGKIIKSDVTVAKNYLSADELSELARVVTTFLDQAESRARRRLPTAMSDWLSFMSRYLDFNEYPVLQDAGAISKAQADEKALTEYEAFRERQDAEHLGEFERFLLESQ
ncbi:MAG: virulence RhuM family protein [Coriobacteriia bacterium]|nr:virulence RhuM family protein [Coriobacteriia bacterium]MCL2750476.1 virulence RhuM family protein [Coriobacteriia bacterium]